VKTRTRGSEAEVDGAIYPSTVTNSGPLRESADKHSIYAIKKRQLVVEEGDESLTAAELFYSLAA
jgi:hypothetical protein